jgi:hypothetical protein
LEIETLILASHAQGKSKEEISLMTTKPLADIEKVLSKYQL